MDRARLPPGNRARLSPREARVLQPGRSLERRDAVSPRLRRCQCRTPASNADTRRIAWGCADRSAYILPAVGEGEAEEAAPGLVLAGLTGGGVTVGFTPSNSTSKIRVEFGPISPPAPR